MRGAERRSCERFAVPGGAVDWQSEAEPGQVATECPLGDLSRGGVRFLTAGPPSTGAALRVILRIPGEPEPLHLRGTVVWTLVSSGQLYNVAVSFAPYAAVPGASNEPAMLERLVDIETRFMSAGG